MNQLTGLAAAGCMAVMLIVMPTAAGSVHAEAPQAGQITLQPESTDPHSHHQKPPFRHIRGGHIVKDTAEMVGMEPKVLVDQLKQGKTLLQIVQTSKGWSEEEYLKKLAAKASANIDRAVAEGKLDQDKAARIKASLPDKLKTIIHRNWKNQMPGHPAMEYHNNQINWVRP